MLAIVSVLQASVFAVNVNDPVPIWRYDIIITGEIKGMKPVFFTKRNRKEYVLLIIKHVNNAIENCECQSRAWDSQCKFLST